MIYIFKYMYPTYIYIYIYIYVYILYIHTYIHVYTHIHTYIYKCKYNMLSRVEIAVGVSADEMAVGSGSHVALDHAGALHCRCPV
jgi:hypothetical protein